MRSLVYSRHAVLASLRMWRKDNSVFTDDEKGEIVGIIILNASKRK